MDPFSNYMLYTYMLNNMLPMYIYTLYMYTQAIFIYFILQFALYIISTIIIIEYYMYTTHAHTHCIYVRKLVSACWLASLEVAANGATYVEAALHQG